jgi:broad specificity phosphatase PhoE
LRYARFPSECIRPLCHLSASRRPRFREAGAPSPRRTDGPEAPVEERLSIELTLVRHGATEWNASGRYQGHSDVELSALGRAQARAIAQRLQSERIERIYSSDLARARATAETIAVAHGLRVATDPRLREFHFGEWEGLTWGEITDRRPHLRDATDIIAAYDPPGGETIDDVIARWKSFHADLVAANHERAVIVTHAGMLHAIVRATKPRGAEDVLAGRFRFLPASLTRLRLDDRGAVALTINDAVHHTQNSPD